MIRLRCLEVVTWCLTACGEIDPVECGAGRKISAYQMADDLL